MARRVRIRRKRENRFSMALVTIVILMVMIVVAFGRAQLKDKQAVVDEETLKLEQDIAREEERSLEIDEKEKYSKTNKYVEEVAREKYGMVKENEIVFKEE